MSGGAVQNQIPDYNTAAYYSFKYRGSNSSPPHIKSTEYGLYKNTACLFETESEY